MSGFALVHNASMCSELGYYYEGHDTKAGAARLIEAIDTHDAAHVAYRDRQRSALQRFMPQDAALVARYAALLDEVVQRPIR